MPVPSDNDLSYSRTVEITASAPEIFQALTKDLQGWWGSMDHPVSKVGDAFRVSWGEPWYRFQVIRYEYPSFLSWECTDANQIIEGLDGVQKEWVGTQLHWQIESIGPKSCRVKFIHQGLVPEFTCFDFCSTAWDHFFGERLKSYLEG